MTSSRSDQRSRLPSSHQRISPAKTTSGTTSMPVKNLLAVVSPIDTQARASHKTVTSTMPGHNRKRGCEPPRDGWGGDCGSGLPWAWSLIDHSVKKICFREGEEEKNNAALYRAG